jgi:hypothetical protein
MPKDMGYPAGYYEGGTFGGVYDMKMGHQKKVNTNVDQLGDASSVPNVREALIHKFSGGGSHNRAMDLKTNSDY